MQSLILSLLLFFLSATLSRTQAPPRRPSLAFQLRDSYTFDTSITSSVRPCRFTGSPAPTVTWTFNGNSLPTSSDTDGVYYNPSDGTLIIEQADSSDDGEYMCTGTNSFGTESSQSSQFTFTSTSVRWYISWYMWFIYAIVIWALTIPVFVIWFFYRKKRAKEDLPAADGWIGN